MANLDGVTPGMSVIGADGVPVGTVDRVVDGRIRLTLDDSGMGHHHGHYHYVPGSLVAEIEGRSVRLSANAAVAVLHEQEDGGEERS